MEIGKTFSLEFVIDKIKVVFLDFDDTLCFHYGVEELNEGHDFWFKSMLEGKIDWYLNEEFHGVSKEMQDFVEFCKIHHISCHCLSWASNNIVYDAKRRLLDEKYPSVKSLFLTGTREAKLEFMKDFCKANGLNRNQILLVDDHPTTRSEFRKEGFYAVNVNTVIQYLQKNPI